MRVWGQLGTSSQLALHADIFQVLISVENLISIR